MSSTLKNMTRFTFDCPTELHSSVKLKACAERTTVKDYIINLIIKDMDESTPRFASPQQFKKAFEEVLEKDSSLLKALADR